MTIDVASVALPWGPLELLEVYSFYEIPRFYSLTARKFPGTIVLVLCTSDDEDSADYLYSSMSYDRFDAIRSGALDVREAYSAPDSGKVWRLRHHFSNGNNVTVSVLPDSTISDADLPLPGVRMQLDTKTAPDFSPQIDVGRRSEVLNRTVVAVELDAADKSRTEFPLKSLGHVQVELQNVLTAIGQEVLEKPTRTGAVQRRVTEQLEMVALPMTRAASYVFLVAVDLERTGQMIESFAVPEVIAKFDSILQLLGGGSEAARMEILSHGPRVRGRVEALLRAVDQSESSFGIIAASPGRPEVIESHLSRSQVVSALNVLDTLEQYVDFIEVDRGSLVGLNTVTGAFHIVDLATGRNYRGGSDDALRVSWTVTIPVGEGSLVSAIIRVERPDARYGEIETPRFTLLRMEAIESNDASRGT